MLINILRELEEEVHLILKKENLLEKNVQPKNTLENLGLIQERESIMTFFHKTSN